MHYNTRKSEGLEDACWEGYEAVGMKEKGGRQVPNCVPTKTAAHRLDGVRGHQLLPATVARKLPAIYSQENVDDPIVQVKLFSPYTNAVWYLTEYDPGSREAFGWADIGYGMGELGYISIPELEGMNRNGLPLVERDLYWRPVPLSKAKGGRTAASASRYPSVARQVEEDYARKAITSGERREMLDAIENAETRRDAERVVEQHRKGRTAAGLVAARYSGDPYWMTARYPGVDSKGRPVKRGDRVFYYPRTKTILTGDDAERASAEFDAASFDEDFGYRGASSTRAAATNRRANSSALIPVVSEILEVVGLGHAPRNQLPSLADALVHDIRENISNNVNVYDLIDDALYNPDNPETIEAEWSEGEGEYVVDGVVRYEVTTGWSSTRTVVWDFSGISEFWTEAKHLGLGRVTDRKKSGIAKVLTRNVRVLTPFIVDAIGKAIEFDESDKRDLHDTIQKKIRSEVSLWSDVTVKVTSPIGDVRPIANGISAKVDFRIDTEDIDIRVEDRGRSYDGPDYDGPSDGPYYRGR